MDAQAQPAAEATTQRRLSIRAIALTFVPDEIGGDRQFDAVILREGVFQPGIGNPDGERIFFPREVLVRMAPGGEGKPVNLEHKKTVLDEVGILTQLRMDDEGVRLRANLVLQQKRPRYTDAIGFIEARQAAGLVPNVSVELDAVVLAPAATPEEKALWDFRVVDAVLTGCAILPNGACSDSAGCGIGLAALTAGFQVLALQGIDAKEMTPMCDQKELVASLQAKVTALEANALKQTTEHATALAAEAAKATALTAQVAEFEKADLEALQEAVEAAAPKGTDVKALLGEKPSKAEMLVALKAFKAAPKAPAAADVTPGLGLGRHTAAVTRGPTGQRTTTVSGKDAEARKAALAQRYKSLGLAAPDKSKVPAALQRNTDRILAPLEAAE